MRSTLFRIWHADPIWGIPIFGFGWLLWLLAAAAVISVGWRVWSSGWNRHAWADLPLLLVVAVMAWVASLLEQPSSVGPPLGLPIRAYGLMVLLGIVAGIHLSVRQARRVGVDPDMIISLCFWIVIVGFVGARAFYVVQYWGQFAQPTVGATLMQIPKLTEGGLVVYGGFAGAVVACIVYAVRHHLPLLALADLLAPGLMLGLAFGRIGCLLHGCCWGGPCDHGRLGITFPPGSPPFIRQLEDGSLMGMQLEREATRRHAIVRSVVPGSAADRQQIRAGDEVETIRLPNAEELNRMRSGELVPEAVVSLQLGDGRLVQWRLKELPARSHPVYPAQVLSSITAALICWFLWNCYPLRRRDGVVFALLVTIYPIARVLEEMIRGDESSVLATSFRWTISQSYSSVLLALVVGLWCFVLIRPPGTAFSSKSGVSPSDRVARDR